MSTTAIRPRARASAFAGLPPAAFSFFAALAEDNTRPWFSAHAEAYRMCADRPWRALITTVAALVGRVLPDVDTEVKTGRVLSRINLQWPRPGAAYRTGLRATFAAAETGRRPGASLFVTLDASGVRAGTEVAAGTAEWGCVLERLAAGGPTGDAWGAPLTWSVAGEVVEPANAPDLSERMRGIRRTGSLRWATTWGPADEAIGAAGFADRVWEALRGAMPLYLCAKGAAEPGTLAEVAERMVGAMLRLDATVGRNVGASLRTAAAAEPKLTGSGALRRPGDANPPLPASPLAATVAAPAGRSTGAAGPQAVSAESDAEAGGPEASGGGLDNAAGDVVAGGSGRGPEAATESQENAGEGAARKVPTAVAIRPLVALASDDPGEDTRATVRHYGERGAGGVAEADQAPSAEPEAAGRDGAYDLPPLPRSLLRVLAARAEAEGVGLSAFILFVLTQAAGTPA